MRVDEMERALREAAAGQEPVADGRNQVTARLRRHRMRQWAVGLVAVGVLATGGLTWEPWESPASQVDTAGPTVTSAPVDPAVARCFPTPAPVGQFTDVGPRAVGDLPTGLPPLLVLSDQGELWVVQDGTAERWTSGEATGPAAPGYLWARWAADGSIYASRFADGALALERLTGPGQASTAVDLPYTVKADAPVGVCPIDGYLASFTIEAGNLWLVRHIAGPVPHGCPPLLTDGPPDTDPWRCASREAIGFEVRRGDFDHEGSDLGLTMGGSTPLPIAGDSSGSGVFAVALDGTVTMVNDGACCPGGQEGTAFALSPDGQRMAYSPDGATISIAELESSADDDGPTMWTSPDTIDAIAWTDGWIVVAHGGRLTLVAEDGSSEVEVAGLDLGSVVTLDWSSAPWAAEEPTTTVAEGWVSVTVPVLHQGEELTGPVTFWAWIELDVHENDPPSAAFYPQWEALYQNIALTNVEPPTEVGTDLYSSDVTVRVPPEAAQWIVAVDDDAWLAASPQPPGDLQPCGSEPLGPLCPHTPQFSPPGN